MHSNFSTVFLIFPSSRWPLLPACISDSISVWNMESDPSAASICALGWRSAPFLNWTLLIWCSGSQKAGSLYLLKIPDIQG